MALRNVLMVAASVLVSTTALAGEEHKTTTTEKVTHEKVAPKEVSTTKEIKKEETKEVK